MLAAKLGARLLGNMPTSKETKSKIQDHEATIPGLRAI